MKSNLYWMLGLVLLVWLVEIVNLSMGYRLNEWGILPRSSTGLLGILVSPFLHGGDLPPENRSKCNVSNLDRRKGEKCQGRSIHQSRSSTSFGKRRWFWPRGGQ